jgi:hypothetical protein
MSPATATITTWTGSLNGGTGGGIIGTDVYNSSSTTMNWSVIYDSTTQKYSYDYIFAVVGVGKKIQHILLETTPDIPSDMKPPVNEWKGVGYAAGMTTDYSLYAKKISKSDITSTSTDFTWEYTFTSTHAPVWGDFFAECDGVNTTNAYAYNKNFDGYIWSTAYPGGKIAVPDGVLAYPKEVVPEASTLVGFGSALVMAGPGMIGWLRKRRS